MKEGDKIKIYQKPLTEEDYEGEAVLVKYLLNKSVGGVFLEKWLVQFPDGSLVERIINTSNLKIK